MSHDIRGPTKKEGVDVIGFGLQGIEASHHGSFFRRRESIEVADVRGPELVPAPHAADGLDTSDFITGFVLGVGAVDMKEEARVNALDVAHMTVGVLPGGQVLEFREVLDGVAVEVLGLPWEAEPRPDIGDVPLFDDFDARGHPRHHVDVRDGNFVLVVGGHGNRGFITVFGVEVAVDTRVHQHDFVVGNAGVDANVLLCGEPGLATGLELARQDLDFEINGLVVGDHGLQVVEVLIHLPGETDGFVRVVHGDHGPEVIVNGFREDDIVDLNVVPGQGQEVGVCGVQGVLLIGVPPDNHWGRRGYAVARVSAQGVDLHGHVVVGEGAVVNNHVPGVDDDAAIVGSVFEHVHAVVNPGAEDIVVQAIEFIRVQGSPEAVKNCLVSVVGSTQGNASY